MSSFRNFPSAHVHPHSFDSASTPEAFLKRELELQTGYLTVTDHGSLAACRKIYDLAHNAKITPILGIEAYVRDDDCSILKAGGISKNDKGTFADYQKYYHLTMHFLDQDAYETGVKLLSLADARAERHGSERKPLFNWNDLEELGSKNVTMTSSCLIGMISRHLVQSDRPDLALGYFNKLRSIVKPGNFYVELFPHVCDRVWKNGVVIVLGEGTRTIYWDSKKLLTNVGEITAIDLVKEFSKKSNEHHFLIGVKERSKYVEFEPKKILSVEKIEDFLPNDCTAAFPDGDVQKGANKFVLELAEKYKLPILIGDDSHFATPEEKIVQDIRLSTYSQGNWKFSSSYHRQDSKEAFDYFLQHLDISEATFEKWIDSSHEWAHRFKGFEFKTEISLPTKFYLQPNDSSLEYLFKLIHQTGRYDESNPKYRDRLIAEIKLLKYNGIIDLIPYFFIDEEICRVYEKNGLLTGPGRGCFLPDTLVLLKDNKTKPIQEIQIGDIVYSDDNSENAVEHLWTYPIDEEIIKLHFLDGTIIGCTLDHQFFTTLGWESASKLATIDSKMPSAVYRTNSKDFGHIYQITREKYTGLVYDLMVKNRRTYNVHGYVVHNSAAGLLLSYLLGITHVDPLQYDLSMDRFLTIDRIKSGKLPDIDLDLQTREFLVDDAIQNLLEIELEDGRIIKLLPKTLVKTCKGELLIEEALVKGLEVDL